MSSKIDLKLLKGGEKLIFFYIADVPFISVLRILKSVFINWSAFAVLQHDSTRQLCKNS